MPPQVADDKQMRLFRHACQGRYMFLIPGYQTGDTQMGRRRWRERGRECK